MPRLRKRRTRYNAAMTTTAPFATAAPGPGSAADPWSRLTVHDATRTAAALRATHTATTRKVYAHAWSQWERWCAGRGLASLPADPAAVCAYLTERVDQGGSLAGVDSACSAIGHRHRSHGLPDPIDHDAVRQVPRGLRRILGTAPRRPARPLTVPELRRIVTAIDRSTPHGARDAALILLGFAGALRRSELAAFALADVEAKPADCCCTCAAPRPTPHAADRWSGSPTASTPRPTRSPSWTAGSASAAPPPGRCSPACAPAPPR
jgi:hypothetical protein